METVSDGSWILIRWLRRPPVAITALFAALTLVSAACDSTGDTTTTTVAVTSTTNAPAITGATEAVPAEGFTYKVGMIPDISRPNHWAMKGPDGTIPMC